ncbi:MAG: Peptide chain release factor 1 [Parcubacteria group bacterium GW2011_GWA1_60_11]|nr:MAG: Peptide chain release factor 1 [Parcubacteria group bacterium GW2011_GWA1_60_11]
MQRIILEVRAGTGGDEASLFAGDLARMYQRYAAKRGWRFVATDSTSGTLGGYKTFVAEIAGEDVYEALKHEFGVHRVQRIPSTEKSGRVHTSTASVAILPLVEAKQLEIKDSELEVSFSRAGGPGGQNVNKIESAVRILHKPTGIVVSCRTERQQHKNRERAMEVLRAKLYEEQQRQAVGSVADIRREQIGPEDRITDHRIGKKWHNIEAILDGDLDPVVRAFQKSA